MDLIAPEIDLSVINPRNYNNADYQYECLKEEILAFQRTLDDEHEVALMLASFGQNITLAVTDIDYRNPSLLLFYGYVNGNFTTLVQHISQLSFLMTAIPKHDPDEPPRRIGFDVFDSDSK